jgi:hypothetical protein
MGLRGMAAVLPFPIAIPPMLLRRTPGPALLHILRGLSLFANDIRCHPCLLNGKQPAGLLWEFAPRNGSALQAADLRFLKRFLRPVYSPPKIHKFPYLPIEKFAV